jgi:GntR family transcriptional regulator
VNIFLDYHSRTPIYEQIKEQIVLDISRGVLKKDDQLPSLRQLSAQLSININTVKRALSELEAQGVIYSVAGKGIFISGNAESQNIYLEQSLDAVKNALINAKQMGASEEKIAAILKDVFKGVE